MPDHLEGFMQESGARSESRALLAKYVLNGLVATAVHYVALTINLKLLLMPHAAVANFLAAIAGICVSFAGNRYFVFRAHAGQWLHQFARFWLLYACIAFLHAGVLWVWTDFAGFDYRPGFLIATCLQFVLSFFGNKKLVFR